MCATAEWFILPRMMWLMTTNAISLVLAMATRPAAVLETQVSTAYGTLVSTSIPPIMCPRQRHRRLLLLLQPARHLILRNHRPPLILQARLLNLQRQLHQMHHREAQRSPTSLVSPRAPLLALSFWEAFWELPFSP